MSKKDKDSILLSPKYGVNPSITHCEICGKEIGIALLGKLKDDAEAPRDVALGLCDDCQKVMDAEGVIVIEVRDGETGDNPYRTGRLVGMSKDWKEKVKIEHPVCYMEQSMFSELFDNTLNSEKNEGN